MPSNRTSAVSCAPSVARSIFIASFVLLSGVWLTGCQPVPSTESVKFRVIVDGQPIRGIKLQLFEDGKDTVQPKLVGLADSEGWISMQLVDANASPPGPNAKLKATIESLGDGDWQIGPPWNDSRKTSLTVIWPPSLDKQEIVIPKSAIRPL